MSFTDCYQEEILVIAWVNAIKYSYYAHNLQIYASCLDASFSPATSLTKTFKTFPKTFRAFFHGTCPCHVEKSLMEHWLLHHKTTVWKTRKRNNNLFVFGDRNTESVTLSRCKKENALKSSSPFVLIAKRTSKQ